MRAIRRKIYVVIVMLVAAVAVSIAIYFRGGFSIAGSDDVGYCGTVDPSPKILSNPVAANGGNLFKTNCTSCHAMDKTLTGPALIGASDRVPYKNFIEDLLLNPKRTLKQNDYARQLSKEYGDNGHMDFSGILSKTEIEEIISYTKFYTHKATDQIMAKS